MLDEGATPMVTAQMRQCELAAAEQSVDDSYQRMNSGSMADDGVALQPVFQQSQRVHAVLSDLDGSVWRPPLDQTTACMSIPYLTVFPIVPFDIRGDTSDRGVRRHRRSAHAT